MTKTRKATSLPLAALTTLLSASGWGLWLNHTPLVTQTPPEALEFRVPSPVRRIVPAFESTAPTPQKAETTAEKRARFAPLITAAAAASKVEPALIEAIMTAESAFNPLAVSKAGAVGLMQLMPDTAARYGVKDRWDPAQNILGGARYLSFLLEKFNNNHKLAIAAYNAGEGAVEKHRNRIPPYSETRKYVPKVLAYYQQYRAEA
jgi:soluble lytic murein transglycosylase-like protein